MTSYSLQSYQNEMSPGSGSCQEQTVGWRLSWNAARWLYQGEKSLCALDKKRLIIWANSCSLAKMGIIKFIKPTEFRVFPNMSHSHFPKQWQIKQQGSPGKPVITAFRGAEVWADLGDVNETALEDRDDPHMIAS